MPPRRPAHKAAHAVCPNGVFNWSECDAAVAHQWGRCKAMVDDKAEPRECSNWAVAEEGWCGQHYASKIEGERRAERIAIKRDAMNARADAYIEWTRDHPSVHERMGVVSVAVKERARHKGPHRIDW